MSYKPTQADSRPRVSPSANLLLTRIREHDGWSADALASVLRDHPDLVFAVYDEIEVLLNPEVLLGVAPPVTREDWEDTSRSSSAGKRAVSDDELRAINSFLEPVRERLQGSTARRYLREAIRREFRSRSLPVPPSLRRGDTQPASVQGAATEDLAEPSFDQSPSTTPSALGQPASSSPTRQRGRPPLPAPTYATTIMLTLKQVELVDLALAQFNTVVKGYGGHRVKRNHIVQAFLDAIVASGYDLSKHDTLASLRNDLVVRLRARLDGANDS